MATQGGFSKKQPAAKLQAVCQAQQIRVLQPLWAARLRVRRAPWSPGTVLRLVLDMPAGPAGGAALIACRAVRRRHRSSSSSVRASRSQPLLLRAPPLALLLPPPLHGLRSPRHLFINNTTPGRAQRRLSSSSLAAGRALELRDGGASFVHAVAD